MSVEAVLKTFKENAEKGKKILMAAIPKIGAHKWDDIIKERQVTYVSDTVTHLYLSKVYTYYPSFWLLLGHTILAWIILYTLNAIITWKWNELE